MAIYSIGRLTTGTTSGNAAFDVACDSTERARIMELAFMLSAAAASTYGLNRPTALGTRTTPVALLAEDPADGDPAEGLDSALAWSVQPTLATDDLRRIGLPATIGTGIIWTFPRGLVIAQSKSIALVNRATNGAVNAYAVVDR
jgi:hypothetical protein